MSVVKIKDLGTFTYNYKIELDKKYNVISAVLFKSANVTSFSRYTGNLLNYVKIKQIIDKTFVFRLYYDNSILDDDYIKTIFYFLNKNYQLVHYDCPAFKDDDGIHNGTFGTLMRFLPFHDFPENDVDNCYICDTDDKLKYIEQMVHIFLQFQNKYKLKLLYEAWMCHESPYNLNTDNYIRAKCLLNQKIPLDFLIHYVNIVVPILLQKYEKLKINIPNKTSKKYKHKFFYGTDEIYLELYLKTYFDKKKIKYARYYQIYSDRLYLKLSEMFAGINNELKSKCEKIVVSINQKFKTEYNSLHDFFKIFKNYDWERRTNMHKQYLYFHKKVIKMYKRYPDLQKFNNYGCFKKMDKFIDNTNKLELFY